jgi:hypothetical protein
MKIKIGPYKDYFGPYQLAQKILFWVPKEKDEHGFPHTADCVHKFGEWLAHGSIKPEPEVGEEHAWDDDRPETWIYKLLLWIDKKKKRKIKVHIDRWDTWGMSETLGYIVRPMLKQLIATKHGAPWVDDEDVPEELRSTSARELTEEEKKARDDARAAKVAEAKLAADESAAKEAEVVAALDELGKIQHGNDKVYSNKSTEISARLQV